MLHLIFVSFLVVAVSVQEVVGRISRISNKPALTTALRFEI